jgi:hypothetical protein
MANQQSGITDWWLFAQGQRYHMLYKPVFGSLWLFGVATGTSACLHLVDIAILSFAWASFSGFRALIFTFYTSVCVFFENTFPLKKSTRLACSSLSSSMSCSSHRTRDSDCCRVAHHAYELTSRVVCAGISVRSSWRSFFAGSKKKLARAPV